MDALTQWLENVVGLPQGIIEKLLLSMLWLAVILVIRFVALTIVNRQTEHPRLRYNWRKGLSYTTSFIFLLVLGRIWLEAIDSLSTFLGLFSAGIAIALRDPIVNLAAWIFILWRKPFEVGDRIQIGEYSGDVIDLRIFQFAMLEIGNWVDADQSTGRIVQIPNGRVFNEMLANYSKGFQHIWHEIPVLVTFESDWQKAEEILSEIASSHGQDAVEQAAKELRASSNKLMIFYQSLTPIVWITVKDSGVLLTIRYLCGLKARRSTEAAIWRDILTRFAEHDNIDFAYPTTRFYRNDAEGKPGTRPPE